MILRAQRLLETYFFLKWGEIVRWVSLLINGLKLWVTMRKINVFLSPFEMFVTLLITHKIPGGIICLTTFLLFKSGL
jgi:hypothetical protein